jgi:hypothetical protein
LESGDTVIKLFFKAPTGEATSYELATDHGDESQSEQSVASVHSSNSQPFELAFDALISQIRNLLNESFDREEESKTKVFSSNTNKVSPESSPRPSNTCRQRCSLS